LPGNLRVAILAFAICVVLLVLVGLLSREGTTDAVFGRPSTFFTDPTGARGIYLVLGELWPEGEVGQWRRPLTLLGEQAGEPSTLVVMGPSVRLGPRDADALDAWLEAGGQLVLAASAPWRIAGPDPESADDYAGRHGIAHPEDLDAGAAIDAARTVALGAGRLVYVPDAHAFSNGNLVGGDRAVWLAAAVSAWGGPVWFDEYHQGFGSRRGLMAIVGSFLVTPWGLAVLQMALAGAVYILGYRKRFGRPTDLRQEPRTSRVETVEALGALFRAAEARELSVKVMDQYLTASLSSDLGYRVDLSDPGIRKRMGESVAGDIEAYSRAVGEVLGGRRPEDAEFVRIGQMAALIGRSVRHGTTRRGRRARAG
jgi:hypothetical protein